MTNQTARASHPPRRALGGARTCTPCTGGGRRRAGRDVRDGSARAALQDKPVGTRQTPRRVARNTRRTRRRTSGTPCPADSARRRTQRTRPRCRSPRNTPPSRSSPCTPRHRHEVLVVARHARRAVRARRALFHARKARPVGAVVPVVADRTPARRRGDIARRAKHRARPARVVAQEHPRRGVARRAECRVPRAREAVCVARCVSGRCASDAGRRLPCPHMTRRRTSG